jgi:hypothetical protein
MVTVGPLLEIYFLLNMTRLGARIAQRYIAGLRAGWSAVRVPLGAGNFPRHHRVQTGSGEHPSSYSLGTRGSFPAEVKNAWSYTSASQYAFMA